MSLGGSLVATCFFCPLLNIHRMGSGQQKANPGVAGVAMAVQENCSCNVLSPPHMWRIINKKRKGEVKNDKIIF